MAATTPHWGFPTPDGTDAIAQGDDLITALATALDAVTMFQTGLFVDRPAGKTGLHWISTDVLGGRVDFYDGTEWVQVYPSPLYQTGDLKLSAVATEPTGWLKCDGRAVPRSTYAALYAALGGASSPHGQGDGTTTFNLPDYAGRAIVGTGSGTGLTTRSLGTKFGEENHLLTASESGLPSHAHGYDAGHNSTDLAGGFSATADSDTNGVNTTHPAGGSNATNAHNTCQPSAPAVVLIKT